MKIVKKIRGPIVISINLNFGGFYEIIQIF